MHVIFAKIFDKKYSARALLLLKAETGNHKGVNMELQTKEPCGNNFTYIEHIK